MRRPLYLILFLSISMIAPTAVGNRLKKINREIKDIENKITILKKEGASVLNDLYKIELQYKKAKKEENRINFLLSSTKKEIEKNKVEKKNLEKGIGSLKKRLKKVLRILYKTGNIGKFKIFFNVKNLDQLFRNYQLFIALINFNVAEITKIKNLIEKLKKVEEKLRHEYNKLVKLRATRKRKVAEISGIRNRKLDFISKINSDRKRYLAMLSDLKLEAEKLNQVIKRESGKIVLPDIDLKGLKGKLNWPLKGKIVSGFGKAKSTKFNTYIFNNGIEIKPSSSLKIKAVFSGVIIFQNYFKGYGNIIIVQHSKTFLTIYGHCEKFLKNRDDFVSGGDVIGVVGDSGSTIGVSLYFEIRRGTKAVNPLEWLKR